MASLRQVIDLLGDAGTRLVSGDLDAEVLSVRVHDPADGASGALVLGVNVAAGQAHQVAEDARAGGAAALVLRPDAAAATGDVGIAVLASSLPWELLREQVLAVLSPPLLDDGTTPIRDLSALANAIAGLMGAAVAIEDPQSNLLAYSNLGHPIDEAREQTILARRNPDAWAARMDEVGIAQLLQAAPEGAVRIVDPLGKARDRVAILVRAGAEVLGSIWVVRGDEPFDDRAEKTLQDAAPLAALQLLRHRTLTDVTRRRQGALLTAVLDGNGTQKELHLEDGPCAVVAFAFPGDLGLDLPRGRDLVVDLVTVACEAYRRRVVCTWNGSVVYALFPSLRSADGLPGLVREICKRASEVLGLPVKAGLGSVVASLAGAPVARREADRAARVVVRTGQAVAAFDDVRVPSNLLELTDFLSSRPDLRLPVLAAIAAEDADDAKGYLATLRAFTDAGGDVALAAERMHVHKNTVRYRLKRLQETYGLDPFDPAQYLLVALELRLG